MEAVLCLFGLVGALCVWTLVSPQAAWRTTMAWRFRDPKAAEPSRAGFTAQRVGAFFGLIAVAAGAAAFVLRAQEAEAEQRVHEYQECLEEYDDQPSLLTPEEWCENLSPPPEP